MSGRLAVGAKLPERIDVRKSLVGGDFIAWPEDGEVMQISSPVRASDGSEIALGSYPAMNEADALKADLGHT